MLILRDRLLNTPIMSLRTGSQVGVATSPIIDPRRLHIVGFYCEGPGIEFKPAILHTADIREFSDIGIIIDDADDIMESDGLVRLQEILDFEFELEGKKVEDDGGMKLGKVSDFATDIASFLIIKLHVQPSLFQSFGSAEHLIDRSQIVTITDDKIVVRRPTVKEESHAVRMAKGMVDNPFRKAKPQAEAADNHQGGR